jgi:hypothetical protein
MSNLKLFDLFKDTLIMLANNKPDIKGRSIDEGLGLEDIIKNYLDELEGDVYTFLHQNNLEQLENDSLISGEIIRLASSLREAILSLPKELWTVKAYQEDIEWERIHLSARTILDILER